MIGKRKRENRVLTRSEEGSFNNTTHSRDTHDGDIFRQYFENQFEPLETTFTIVHDDSISGDSDDDSSHAASLSDWGGLSGDESIPPVEIIEYGEKEKTDSADDVQGKKSFMVGLQIRRELQKLNLHS